MHEMGITQGILSAAIEAAEAEGATRINEVRISVGDMTDVVETALQFAFEVLREDTMAGDATLVVNHVSPKSHCSICDLEFEHDKWDLTCPKCGGFFCEVLEGRELRIDSIDIDNDEPSEEQG
jgi:hydrogenase nickel incorporation protein HypA/HybF